MKLVFSRQFYEQNIQSYFMKNHPVGAESSHADGQKTSTKPVDALSKFC